MLHDAAIWIHMISIYFSCRLYQLWGFSNMFPHACQWVFSAAKPGKTAGLEIEEGSWAWDKARSACWSFNSSIVQANGRGYLICRWISDIKDSQPKNPTSKFPSNRMLTRPRSSIHDHTSTFNHSSDYDVHDSHLSNGRPLDVKVSGSPLLVPGFRLAEFFGWPGSHNMQDMRNFRNFKTTKCTSNWTSRSWRCKLARFCFCSWTTALAKSYRIFQDFSGTEQLDSSVSSETNPQTLGSVSHDSVTLGTHTPFVPKILPRAIAMSMMLRASSIPLWTCSE